ncbi:MAG: two-component regulator propeller domain-containing protein [Ferruginibacter sp.]
MLRRFLLAGILTILIYCLQAQQTHYQFSHLDIAQGLSNNQVTSFLKDEDGFIWIGTVSGLNRYDGYQFRIFRHSLRDSSSLLDDNVTRILQGPNKKIWIETRSGFNIYDPVTEGFDRNVNAQLKQLGLPATAVNGIITGSDGNFFFMMNAKDIYRYTNATGKATLLYSSVNKTSNLTAFTLDNSGGCWLIQQNGLAERVDINTGKRTASTDIASKIFGTGAVTYSLFVDSENELWIYPTPANAKGGVVWYKPVTGQYVYLEKDNGTVRLNNNLVVGVQQDSKGLVWVCTDHGGVNIYDKKTNSIQYLLNNIDDDKSLSQNSIIASYKDETGTIWLGTFKKGVNYYHENIIKFPVYRHQPSNSKSLSFDDVNRFAEDAAGNLWIGTNGGGLLYFNRSASSFTQYLHDPGNSNSIGNNVIVSLLIDHEQNLWIGSYFGGLDRFKNGQFTHYRHDAKDPNSLADDRVWEVFEDSKNNLWIGMLDGGLDRFDKEKNIFYHHSGRIPNSLNSNYVAAIVEDREGRFWLGTDNGVDVLDVRTNKVIHYGNYSNDPNAIANNNVPALFRDSRGLMWIGTRDGLSVYNKKKNNFQSFRTEEGLPGNTILNILEDDRKTLWISTNNGIANIAVSMNSVEDKPVSIVCINYDELDGLQGTEFNENAALKTSKGEIIFGGARGFNIFHPEQLAADRSPQHLAITSLQIFNKPVNVGEEINGRVLLPQSITSTPSVELKYNENMLALEFAALNFFAPQKVKYAYQLEGFNKEWIYTDAKMRKAIYTNLDPGTYNFRLKASLEDGSWSSKELLFEIKILPPFWKTPLAFLLYVLFVAGVLWLARRIVVERAKMRFEAVHQRKEAERIQALDVMKTKFFTNVSHEFRTPLSLILSPLDKIVKESTDPNQKKQLHLIQRNAKRLLNLINQLLDFRKMEVQQFSVVFAKGDIIKFAKDISYSFSDIAEKKDIELTFYSNTESLQTLFDKDKLEKIFFNLLSNAFKYTPGGGKVKVEMRYEETASATKNINIKISDTGIGIPEESQVKIFEPYFQEHLPGNMHNYGTGIGLAITKEFVKLHEGNIKVESETGKGTSFIISLPIKEEEHFAKAAEIKETVLASEKETSLSMDIDSEESMPAGTANKKQTVLLVEDNEDFRFYLNDNLKHQYNVIEAVNGKEGWEKVREHNPDIVVSDIMMPVMTGIELARKIKTETVTSHIPVVLLTAMSAVEKELEGFQAGANDYITKPFTFEILESRIRNLLQLRLQMQKKFQKQLEVNPSEITVTPADEEFMKRALAAVEKNMDKPEFSVEDLSRELFMSRVSLYKKLLSLTGKSPIEFIRIMRLKRAAQLLKAGTMNISEVAYEVGFNNPKVFTRYFKEEFNLTPSQYQSEK